MKRFFTFAFACMALSLTALACGVKGPPRPPRPEPAPTAARGERTLLDAEAPTTTPPTAP